MTTHAEESKYAEERLSSDIPTLEAEIVALTEERERVIKSTREFLAAEDPAKGIYHNAEIFELQQSKLRIGVEIQFRTAKINRIKMGIDDMAGMDSPKNGFVF